MLFNIQEIDGRYEVYSTKIGSGIFIMEYDGADRDEAVETWKRLNSTPGYTPTFPLQVALYGETYPEA
jgi:hypothetical protein